MLELKRQPLVKRTRKIQTREDGSLNFRGDTKERGLAPGSKIEGDIEPLVRATSECHRVNIQLTSNQDRTSVQQ